MCFRGFLDEVIEHTEDDVIADCERRISAAERLMNTPFVLPRSSTDSAPSAVMLTAAWTSRQAGPSMTTSACGDRPMVFLSLAREDRGQMRQVRRWSEDTLESSYCTFMNRRVEHRSIVIDGGPFHEGWDALLHPAREDLAAVGDDGNRRGEIEYVRRGEAA